MNLQDFIISDMVTVIEAMAAIDKAANGIVYICEGTQLRGVITDGDIRRHILKKGSLTAAVGEVANYHPYFLNQEEVSIAEDFMRSKEITSVPIVDKERNIVSIKFLRRYQAYKNTDLQIPVVIMAGGKGERLHPYTKIIPKPLFPIGDHTITELIMDRFDKFTCHEFFIIVNYKKDIIKSYFNDNDSNGKRKIRFVDETDYLGTGGGLTLLPHMSGTFFMTNCDILIDDDYSAMVSLHRKNKNIITMACVTKKSVVPYGTVDVSASGNVLKLVEKPSYSYIINTGFYIIEPEFIEYIPKDQFIHITDVIQKCIEDGKKVGAFFVNEKTWFDMGQLEELEQMKERLNIKE